VHGDGAARCALSALVDGNTTSCFLLRAEAQVDGDATCNRPLQMSRVVHDGGGGPGGDAFLDGRPLCGKSMTSSNARRARRKVFRARCWR
jgi:hypothetical protein